MDRMEFMRQLERLLQGISPTEREEALQYYNSYFDDAGVENEQEVIRALGSPARVAENIKSGLFESGIVEIRQQSQNEEDSCSGSTYRDNTDNGDAYGESSYREMGTVQEKSTAQNGLPAWAIVLIVLACVCAAPVIIPIALGIIGTLFGIIVAWFAMIFGFGVAAVALFAVLVFLVVLGCMCFVVEPLVSVALMGGGLICGGLGILFLMLTVAMAGIVTPAAFRGICWLFRPHKKAMA